MDQHKTASINIAMLQARDALLGYFRPILHDAGITDQQWRIIRLLAENGTMDFRELASAACILRPSLTGILNRLEQGGILIRMKPSNDQRRVFLKLTPAGSKVYEDTRSLVDQCYDEIEQKLTKEKMEQLHGLLEELAALKQSEPE